MPRKPKLEKKTITVVVNGTPVAVSHSNHDNRSEALTAFAEYNCAVAKAPPIPFRAYRRWGDDLNQAWKDRQIEPQPAATKT